jgi:hypothetical protein
MKEDHAPQASSAIGDVVAKTEAPKLHKRHRAVVIQTSAVAPHRPVAYLSSRQSERF